MNYHALKRFRTQALRARAASNGPQFGKGKGTADQNAARFGKGGVFFAALKIGGRTTWAAWRRPVRTKVADTEKLFKINQRNVIKAAPLTRDRPHLPRYDAGVPAHRDLRAEAGLIAQFCQPVWEWWVASGVLQGVLEPENIAIEDVYETRWTTPAPGYINPVQEILAYEKAHTLAIMSLQQIAKETGADFTQITIENAMSVMLKEKLAKDPRIQAIIDRMAAKNLATYADF